MTNRDRREFLGVAGAAVLAGAMPGCAQQPVSATGAAKAPGSVPGYQSASELADAIKARRVSSVEVVDHVIARIERFDPALNAVVVRDFEAAREAARAADKASQGGDRRPLLGVPIVVKESFNVAGLATTWGIPQQKNFIAKEDAVVIARLKNAGAIILGKTNVPFMLSDFQTYNDIYGTTNNPWNPARTSGGSSGGSAAALAAGFGPISVGSDIGGSLRHPSHFCGVYGHKPSLNLVPVRGQNPPPFAPLPRESDLDVCGPMSRTATDLMLALEIIAGPDERMAGIGYRLALPPPRHAKLEQYRVLVLDRHPIVPTSSAVAGALDRRVELLAKEGVTIARQSAQLPDLVESMRLYLRLLLSALSVGTPPDAYARAQKEAATFATDDRSLDAEAARGAVLSHRDWLIADAMRRRLREQWRELFREVDVVLCPPMPMVAFPHDHAPFATRRIEIDGKNYSYRDAGLAWAEPATTPGLPATVMPMDRSDDGLPVGMQIIGPFLEDRTPLTFAALTEQRFGAFVPPPGYT